MGTLHMSVDLSQQRIGRVANIAGLVVEFLYLKMFIKKKSKTKTTQPSIIVYYYLIKKL